MDRINPLQNIGSSMKHVILREGISRQLLIYHKRVQRPDRYDRARQSWKSFAGFRALTLWDPVSCLINRFQVPGRAWVPSSLYERGRLGNLGVTSHVFKDTMEYGRTKVVRMQPKVFAVKLFRHSCPAWNWQYSFM